MKRFFLIFAALALITTTATAQFVTGPRFGAAASITTNYTKWLGHEATNISSPIAFKLTGVNPVKWYVLMGTTNASTSNLTFNFQVSHNATDWNQSFVPGGAGIQVSMPLKGTAAAVGFTNILSAADASGVNWIRLYSITNITAGAVSNTVFITNMGFLQVP